MKPTDLVEKPPSILIYGPPGSFKTGLVSQASGAYLFDFDDGMKTALKVQDKFTNRRHQIEFDTYNDELVTKPTAWLNARSKIQQISNDSANKKFNFDGIIIDSLTGMVRAAQLYVMSLDGDPLAKPHIKHWGDMVHQVESALSILRGIRCLKIVTAHELFVEKEIKSEDGKKVLSTKTSYHPMSVTQKHSINKLMWLFDEVWHSEVHLGARSKSLWVLSSRSTDAIKCRTRSGFPERFTHNDVGLEGVLKEIGYTYDYSNFKII